MIATELIAALELPPNARVDRQVPKTLLLEHGAPTAADKRRIKEGIEEVQWVATLKYHDQCACVPRCDARIPGNCCTQRDLACGQ